MQVRSIVLLSTVVLVGGPALAAPAGFVTVDAKTKGFRLEGCEHRFVGVTVYPIGVAASGTDAAYTTRVLEAAKARGATLVRLTDILFEHNLYDWDRHLGEVTWTRVDWVLREARRLDMRVLLDLSSIPRTLDFAPGRCTSTCAACCDWSDSSTFAETDRLWSFVPSRVNTFTGVAYKDDPALFGYAILGEPMPFGRQTNADGTVKVGSFVPRNVDAIEAYLFHAADRLHQADSNHLVTAGGLLHMGTDSTGGYVPKDATGKEYWKTMWSSPRIDYAAIHVYNSGVWGSEYASYVAYAAEVGKPFVLEETGVDQTQHSEEWTLDFFASAWKSAIDTRTSGVILWNWEPGDGAYHIYPGATALMDRIVRMLDDRVSSFPVLAPGCMPALDGGVSSVADSGVDDGRAPRGEDGSSGDTAPVVDVSIPLDAGDGAREVGPSSSAILSNDAGIAAADSSRNAGGASAERAQNQSGCSCRASGQRTTSCAWILTGLALLWVSRRRSQ